MRSTSSVLLGNFDWPHEPSDAAVTKDVTFTNAGDAAVALDLAVAQNGDASSRWAAATVTVPADGTATVQVTGDPHAVDFGRYVGYVVGTDAATGKAVTRTSLGMVKEDERYDLTSHWSTAPAPRPPAGSAIAMAGDFWPWSAYVDGRPTMRMPTGTYAVSTYLDVQGEATDRSGIAVLVDPETILDQDREVVLDARQARLLHTKAPQLTEDRQRKVDFQLIDKYRAQGAQRLRRRLRRPTTSTSRRPTRSPRAASS